MRGANLLRAASGGQLLNLTFPRATILSIGSTAVHACSRNTSSPDCYRRTLSALLRSSGCGYPCCVRKARPMLRNQICNARGSLRPRSRLVRIGKLLRIHDDEKANKGSACCESAQIGCCNHRYKTQWVLPLKVVRSHPLPRSSAKAVTFTPPPRRSSFSFSSQPYQLTSASASSQPSITPFNSQNSQWAPPAPSTKSPSPPSPLPSPRNPSCKASGTGAPCTP